VDKPLNGVFELLRRLFVNDNKLGTRNRFI